MARKRKLASEINVVPYIDVMLVLLIIFMITAPLLTPGVEIDLPDVAAEPLTQSEEPVTLSVDAAGRFFLDIGTAQAKNLSDEEVVQRVGAVLRNKPQTMILVKGDGRASYERVMRGMSLLKEAGATKVGFMTEPTGPPPRKGKSGKE